MRHARKTIHADAADTLALASCHEDEHEHGPLGIVLLEASGAGCRVIAANFGGLRQRIRERVNGLTSGPDASDAADLLPRQSVTLVDRPGFRKQLVQAGKAGSLTQCSRPRVASGREGSEKDAETRVQGPPALAA